MRFVRMLGWVSFGLGIVMFVLLFFHFSGGGVPKTRWRSRWGQPRWVTARDPAGQFLLDHPSDWDLSTPFERFTKRRLGSVIAVETLALRRGDPIGLFYIISYVAPTTRTAQEWLKEARSGGTLKEQFGARVLTQEPGKLAGVQGLRVIAEDRVRDKTYRFESWFLPAGDTAYRLTGAAPADQFAVVKPKLDRIVASFRFVPGKTVAGKSAAAPTMTPAAAPAEN
jgi:hypothetical protein